MILGCRSVEFPIVDVPGEDEPLCCDVCHSGDLGGSKDYEWSLLVNNRRFRVLVTEYYRKNPSVAAQNVAVSFMMEKMGLNTSLTPPFPLTDKFVRAIEELGEKIVGKFSADSIAEKALEKLIERYNRQKTATVWLLCSTCSRRLEED